MDQEQADFPIQVKQGVDFIQPFYYFNENNVPIDLTGCTAQMQARQTVDADNPPVLDWSTTNGIITINGPAGVVLVAATASQTAALDQMANGVYDLLLTFPGGLVEELVAGPINIVGRVTR